MNTFKSVLIFNLSIILLIVNIACSKEKAENKNEVIYNDVELNLSERVFLCFRGECLIKVNNTDFNQLFKNKYPDAKSFEAIRIEDVDLLKNYRVRKGDKFYLISDDKIYSENVSDLYFELREEPDEIALYFKTGKENINGVCISSQITEVSNVTPSIPVGLDISKNEKNKIIDLVKKEIINKSIITIDDPASESGWEGWNVPELSENIKNSYNTEIKKYNLNNENYYIIKLVRKDRDTDFLDIAGIVYNDKVLHCTHSRINAFFTMNGKFYCNLVDWVVYSEGYLNYLVYFNKDKLVEVKIKDTN